MMNGTFHFQEGEILLIDKPAEWTSFDVVNKIRHLLKHHTGIPKIKVGHAGTLDPLATGLLIVCTGKMTRQINDLTILDKSYTGTITLGATTPSYDRETEIDQTFPIEGITEEMVQKATGRFKGPILQVPPLYSAKRIEGKRAYEYARAKQELVLEPKEVVIHTFEITHFNLPEIEFHVDCSKGTYIRSLAHDLGKELGNGAYLSALRRTRIGTYSIEDSLTLQQFEYLVRSLNEMNKQ
jgi:tRNA pseudouridine55 synthase